MSNANEGDDDYKTKQMKKMADPSRESNLQPHGLNTSKLITKKL